MGRYPKDKTAPTECYCGRLLKRVRLPDDMAAVHGKRLLWLHDNGDLNCYPDAAHPDDQAAIAEPAS